MFNYPPSFSADQFFDRIADYQAARRRRRFAPRLSSSDESHRAQADTVTFGIEKVWIESASGAQSVSRNLNSENFQFESFASDAATRFCFAPRGKPPLDPSLPTARPNEGETVKIMWELKSPKLIGSATIELFHRFSADPIWTQKLAWRDGKLTSVGPDENSDESTAERATAGEIEWDGSFETTNEEVLRKFPGKCIHHSRSPYKLRMTVSGIDETSGHPPQAWTYFDVAVAELELVWGDRAWIPRDRADGIDDPDWTLNQETALFADLSSKSLTDQSAAGPLEVGLKVRIVNGGGESDSSAVANYRAAWGDGPLIPIAANVKLRNSAGAAKRAPNAMAGGRFLWDWEDSPAAKVADWIGVPNQHHARADMAIGVSELSRRFLELTLATDKDNTRHPWDSNNCPTRFGGKRGGGPTVFPAWDAKSPFPHTVVHECTRRLWSAVSLGAALPQAHDTAVLFQPSRMAGDRYTVGVYPAWCHNEADELEVDTPDRGATTTLRSLCAGGTPAVPFAITRRFEVFRKVALTYWWSRDVVKANETAMKAQYKNEGGVVFDPYRSEQVPLTSLYMNFDKHVAERSAFTGDLLMHAAFIAPPSGGADPNFFTEARPHDQARTLLENLFKRGPYYHVTLSSAAQLGHPFGLLLESSGGAQGWVVRVQGNEVLVLSKNDTEFAALDTVQVPGHRSFPPTTTVVAASKARHCWGLAVTVNNATRLTSGHAKVTAQGSAEEANLTFPKGLIYHSRSLDETLRTDLRAMLGRVHAAAPAPKALSFTIEAPSGDRGDTRNQNIEDEIRGWFLDAQAVWTAAQTACEAFGAGGAAALAQFVRGEAGSVASAVVGGFSATDARFAAKPWIIAVHMHGPRTPQLFTSGFWDTGSSRSNTGWCFNWVPPPPPAKRKYKGGTPLIVHEVGHGLFLDHAMDRQPQDKDPSGHNEKQHVVWDTCVMNYDPDTEGFCGMCCLKLRGWDISAMSPTGGLSKDAWTTQANTAWTADANAVPGNVNFKVRLALFLHRRTRPDTVAATTDARGAFTAHLQTFAANPPFGLGTPDHITLLRTLALYQKRGCGDNTERDRYKQAIQVHSTEALDVSGL